jgi:hypothetical protein
MVQSTSGNVILEILLMMLVPPVSLFTQGAEGNSIFTPKFRVQRRSGNRLIVQRDSIVVQVEKAPYPVLCRWRLGSKGRVVISGWIDDV